MFCALQRNMSVARAGRSVRVPPRKVRRVLHRTTQVKRRDQCKRLPWLELWIRQLSLALVPNEWVVRTVLRDTEDRKSTRLNSSHTVISYAVFCLKKKT